MSNQNLFERAEECRRQARWVKRNAEAAFLLRVADEFERLASEGTQPAPDRLARKDRV